jgi:hypothetical protein
MVGKCRCLPTWSQRATGDVAPTEWVSPYRLAPPHDVRDRAKLASLVRSMSVRGWVGRPIVALRYFDEWIALTGSHRIAAAIAVGLDSIPVFEVVDINDHRGGLDGTGGVCRRCGDDCLVTALLGAGVDDDDRLRILHRIGNRPAIRLMEDEIADSG